MSPSSDLVMLLVIQKVIYVILSINLKAHYCLFPSVLSNHHCSWVHIVLRCMGSDRLSLLLWI